MPTNRTRRLNQRRRDVIELDYDCRYELLTGGSMFVGGGFRGDREAFERAWEIHGKALTEEFVAEHPGRRPFAWWVLEHKQERPVVIKDYPGDLKAWERQERECGGNGGLEGGNMFGFLHTRCYGGPSFSPFQEPEEHYLERLGLLTARERRALEAK